jgi:O-antigen/teichoic acid export membrane protein
MWKKAMQILESAASERASERSSRGILSRRASLNALAAGLDHVARIIVELLVNPLLVAGLGTQLYGTWRFLWQWSGYVWATSGRSSQALQFAIANRQQSDDTDEKRSYVTCALVVWCAFLPLLAGTGALGVWLTPHLLNTPDPYVFEVRWAAALLVADSIALTLLTMPRSVLQGENLGYRRMGLSSAFVLLGGCLTALAVHLDTGVVGVAAANLAHTVVTGLLFWRITKRYVPWFGLARPSPGTLRWFFGLSSWFLGWKFVSVLMTASDVLILGVFSSAGLVTVYVLTKFVPEALNRLMVIVVSGVMPGLAGVIGAGDHAKARRVRGETMSFTWLVAAAIGASILLWNASFVNLWVGAEHYAGTVGTLLMVVMVLQFCLIRNDSYLIDATLNLRTKVLVGWLSTLVSVAAGAALVGRYDLGIVGVCAGILAGRTIVSFVYPWRVGRCIGHPLLRQLRSTIRPAAATAALFGTVLVAGRHVGTQSWPVLVIAAPATALVAGVAATFCGLTSEQRWRLVRRVRRVAGSA